jgi:hypothetical protein
MVTKFALLSFAGLVLALSGCGGNKIRPASADDPAGPSGQTHMLSVALQGEAFGTVQFSPTPTSMTSPAPGVTQYIFPAGEVMVTMDPMAGYQVNYMVDGDFDPSITEQTDTRTLMLNSDMRMSIRFETPLTAVM